MKKYVWGVIVALLAVGSIFVVVYPHRTEQKTTGTPKHGLYVALGDSVAAGVGLDSYSDASACNRTRQSYPNKVAASLDYNLQSVACGGATTEQGLLGSQDVNRLAAKPQIQAATSGKKPDLVTITIGANDAHWTTFIQQCYTAVCGSEADTDTVRGAVNTAASNLGQALSQIKDVYPTATPRVVVTGYYKLFPASLVPSCTEQTGIDAAELSWIMQLQDTIDSALRVTTTNYNFASFVPINFAGHELCTTDPWIQGLGAKAAYHPTDVGQAAIARQIIQSLKTNGNAR